MRDFFFFFFFLEGVMSERAKRVNHFDNSKAKQLSDQERNFGIGGHERGWMDGWCVCIRGIVWKYILGRTHFGLHVNLERDGNLVETCT
ncbi:hypothetical protein B0T21DRAFT_137141 [Apiosordaria backusii]|uniref:Uncharacterized protein n=1 Tax=Apiosordaria backusii TaxID=314023 RepID=A0AA40BRU1_9PEZI|nr:hypothetical protein B0T21DRAFT_137141 [Apiosordaria backusii]